MLIQRGTPIGIVAQVGRINARIPEVQPVEVGYWLARIGQVTPCTP
ncbi:MULTISPECIES: hypothetical protein [unclassified Sphingomonas]